jgi:rhodanese-related sulfurtransferase
MIDVVLQRARDRLERVGPAAMRRIAAEGGLVVDIRPGYQRRRDGELPGAIVVDRNVLEWRLDPSSPFRLPEVRDHDQVVVVVCNEGYASSLAAASLQDIGLVRATDLIGGYQAWRGRGGTKPPLVPGDFVVPPGLSSDQLLLEPLAVIHNASDRAAWTSSIEHIRSTPGFAGRSWPPDSLSLDENASDLASHAQDFADRTGFTYTVLDPASKAVIGCVYLYPSRRDGYDVDVRSWVRADRADLDKPLHDLVRRWITESWPFQAPDYAWR